MPTPAQIETRTNLARAALLAACIGGMFALSACAGTQVTVEASVGANVTKSLTGAGYEGGFSGPRDVAQLAIQIQRGRGFCELRHISHLSAGPPFNNRPEDFGDFISCGLRLRRGAL